MEKSVVHTESLISDKKEPSTQALYYNRKNTCFASSKLSQGIFDSFSFPEPSSREMQALIAKPSRVKNLSVLGVDSDRKLFLPEEIKIGEEGGFQSSSHANPAQITNSLLHQILRSSANTSLRNRGELDYIKQKTTGVNHFNSQRKLDSKTADTFTSFSAQNYGNRMATGGASYQQLKQFNKTSKARQLHSNGRLQRQQKKIDDLWLRVTSGGPNPCLQNEDLHSLQGEHLLEVSNADLESASFS